jgi:hypothetical protein
MFVALSVGMYSTPGNSGRVPCTPAVLFRQAIPYSSRETCSPLKRDFTRLLNFV